MDNVKPLKKEKKEEQEVDSLQIHLNEMKEIATKIKEAIKQAEEEEVAIHNRKHELIGQFQAINFTLEKLIPKG